MNGQLLLQVGETLRGVLSAGGFLLYDVMDVWATGQNVTLLVSMNLFCLIYLIIVLFLLHLFAILHRTDRFVRIIGLLSFR